MSQVQFHFEDNLDYQQDAIRAVVELFEGQESCTTPFTVLAPAKSQTSLDFSDIKSVEDASLRAIKSQRALRTQNSTLGVGNELSLVEDEILENLRKVQFRNRIHPLAEKLESKNFTVEMETGTGKTYVYLRTIFELNQKYGFTKFIVVVPSIAIKEGVYATLRQTKDHFLSLYPNAAGFYYFQYDSENLSDVRSFAVSDKIEIMVATIGGLRKTNMTLFHRENEKTNGEKPVDLIRATRPILIVDEPQSVDGGDNGAGREALQEMNPLFTLRYSATHVNKFHPVYSLNAKQAYDKQLVKQVEVAALTIDGDFSRPYVSLIEIKKGKRGEQPCAIIELDIQQKSGISRERLTVSAQDDLRQTSKRDLYADCRIGEINAAKKTLALHHPYGETLLNEGDALYGVDADQVSRLMIRRTIQEHLDKELRLTAKDVKVLSLFFVPSVDSYRIYDKDGTKKNGLLADIFEEEYSELIVAPKYATLFKDVDVDSLPNQVHDGYFSVDKVIHSPFEDMKLSGSKDNMETSSYNLIMKEKEKLLSFDTKLKFIFSHSALKEGWDNPNVFQICSLRDIRTERQRRQTLGRGLRLCVDQTGKRLRGFETNTLTVIANESYERFADELQKEIEAETGIKFGVVESGMFATLPVQDPVTQELSPLGNQESKAIFDHLRENDWIAKDGKVTEALKIALEKGTFSLPDNLKAKTIESDVKAMLVDITSRVVIKNANEKKTINLHKERYLDPQFTELWNRIKHKTTYRVDFDSSKLVADCAEAVKNCPAINKVRARFEVAKISINQGGIGTDLVRESATEYIANGRVPLPDILTELESKTHLTRVSLYQILEKCQRLEDFKSNPQQFIAFAIEAINRTKRQLLVEGIQYKKIGDSEFYAQSLLESEPLIGYLKNLVESQKSVYEAVVCDSQGVEKNFALELERNESVKVYVKLPRWFKVPTPLGSYNPDWAIVMNEDGKDVLYFVVETKSSLWWDDLRHTEGGKIRCAEKHFAAIATSTNPAKYVKATELANVH